MKMGLADTQKLILYILPEGEGQFGQELSEQTIPLVMIRGLVQHQLVAELIDFALLHHME